MIKNKKTIKKFSNRTYVIAIVILVLALVGGTWNYMDMRSNQDKQRKLAMDTCNAIAPITVSKDAESATATDAVGKDRLSRINAIYDSLKLGSDFKLTESNVFGDKKIYEWDNGRTYSSVKNYEKCDDVNNTVNKLRSAIEAAGFKYFEEPYPGSSYTQLHFKSDKNEYIRMTVSSKVRDDAMMANSNNAYSMSPNNGPSNVILKVNLDDNNE